jgi:hypothetical protein
MTVILLGDGPVAGGIRRAASTRRWSSFARLTAGRELTRWMNGFEGLGGLFRAGPSNSVYGDSPTTGPHPMRGRRRLSTTLASRERSVPPSKCLI